MDKLDDKLRQEYFDKHLPYRINSMLSTDLIAHRREKKISHEMRESCYKDSLVLEPSFEISIVFGRSLLQFLGIGFDQKLNNLCRHLPRGTDISIKSIYPNGDFVPLNDDLIVSNESNLCTIVKLANRSVAHLTTSLSNAEEHQQLGKARMTIYRLMLKYVPDINKSNIWWHEQVEKVD